MPVVPVHTSFLISKTRLNEVIGNLKVIFKSLLMIHTILGFSLIVCNQVKNLHVLQSCIFESLRKYITTASTRYLWTYCKTWNFRDLWCKKMKIVRSDWPVHNPVFGDTNSIVRERLYRKKEFIQYYFYRGNLFQKLCLSSALAVHLGLSNMSVVICDQRSHRSFWKLP